MPRFEPETAAALHCAAGAAVTRALHKAPSVFHQMAIVGVQFETLLQVYPEHQATLIRVFGKACEIAARNAAEHRARKA